MELSKLFAAHTSALVLVARSKDKLNKWVDALCSRDNLQVRVLAMDLTRHETPQKIYDQLQVDGIEIDTLVNVQDLAHAELWLSLTYSDRLIWCR
jgi:short-subunit dehydrogenase